MKSKSFSIILAVLVAALLLAFCVLPVSAGDAGSPPVQEEEPTGAVPAFLLKLAGGMGLGVLFSFLAEEVVWFQKLTPDQKKWTFRLLSLLIPVAATALLQNVPQAWWDFLEPYWVAGGMGLAALGAGIFTHKLMKKTGMGAPSSAFALLEQVAPPFVGEVGHET